jgi:hypothetical protein
MSNQEISVPAGKSLPMRIVSHSALNKNTRREKTITEIKNTTEYVLGNLIFK